MADFLRWVLRRTTYKQEEGVSGDSPITEGMLALSISLGVTLTYSVQAVSVPSQPMQDAQHGGGLGHPLAAV